MLDIQPGFSVFLTTIPSFVGFSVEKYKFQVVTELELMINVSELVFVSKSELELFSQSI